MKRPKVVPEARLAATALSSWPSITLCVAIYAAVVVLAWIGGDFSGWWLAPPAMLVIAALQNHLLILLHEGAHLMLHPNKRVNEIATDLFCAVPFLTLVRNYRFFHLTHHKYAGSPERDPEVRVFERAGFNYARAPWPKVLRMFLADLFLVNFFRFSVDMAANFAKGVEEKRIAPFGARDAALYALVWGGVGVPAVMFGFWHYVLVFWIVPQATFLFFLLKLHAYGEHTGATGPTEFERTWVHVFAPVTDFFIYPINSGFHLEHHLFPSVPWYRMRGFRKMLLADEEYRRLADRVTVEGYFFGERTILRNMLVGEGEYRVAELSAATDELEGEVVAEDTRDEIDEQLAVS